jgi:hypothetical protein
MGGGFDAELYLRLSGEHLVLSGDTTRQPGPWGSSLTETAAALVAVDCLDRERAALVVGEYEDALELRGRSRLPGRFRRRGRPPAAPRRDLKPSRVVTSGDVVDLPPWGLIRVDYVSLGERQTSVAISGSGLSHHAGRGHPQTVLITDEQGNVEPADFSGGWSNDGVRSHVVTHRPLPAGTAWIDIGTTRVVLASESHAPTLTMEPVAAGSPAERHLWNRLTSGRHGPHGGFGEPRIDVAVDALVASGTLAADDPVIDQVRSVMAAFSGQPPAANLPEPWAALLSQALRGGGISGCTAIGLVTPPMDGVILNLEALTVNEGVLELHVETSPGVGDGLHASPLDSTPISWWAEDDVGNRYLGSPSRWGSPGDISEGTITYWPALDPSATRIRLTPTGAHERAVIDVPVPDPGWES